MKGDFSRMSFDPSRNFTRVLMQQGRVQLDADWNEQAAILLHLQRAFIADLIGPHAGPKKYLGFHITQIGNKTDNFWISAGSYYVDGILCTMPNKTEYLSQLDYPDAKFDDEYQKNGCLVYLDVWERHLSYQQVDGYHLREPALLGADTATRAQVVAQVKLTAQPDDVETWRLNQTQGNHGKLTAECTRNQGFESDPCLAASDTGYRGQENQLYRVEIHHGGTAGKDASFKWSRDNGSIIFPVVKMDGSSVIVVDGRDDRTRLHQNDLVEVINDHLELRDNHGVLAQVLNIIPGENPQQVQVTLAPFDEEGFGTKDFELEKHPLLRRWDHRPGEGAEGAILVKKVNKDDGIDLENGIRIYFKSNNAEYRSGDYWLIPARSEIGNILWPNDPDHPSEPASLPPMGIEHHYAPLAVITINNAGVRTLTPKQKVFTFLGKDL